MFTSSICRISFFLLIPLLLLNGCYSASDVRVTSTPPGASVYRSAGSGPFKHAWREGPILLRIGIVGKTPVTYKKYWPVEAAKVRWPDGTESEVKNSPHDFWSTTPVNFHFIRKTPSLVNQNAQTQDTGTVAPHIYKTSKMKAGERRAEYSSAQSVSVWTPSAHRCIWVLAVGVGQYKYQSVPNLPFARKDAERVRDWFSNINVDGASRDSIHVLFNEQATRESLLSQIDWLRRKALPEDAIFVYYAGHGAPELASDGTCVDAKYLVLYDTDPEHLYATGFPLDELTRRLDGVKAKTQVVILEACYAGPVGQEVLKKTPTADLEIRPRSIQKLGEKGGRAILSASSGRQMAIGSEAINGSLFTYYLFDAWKDGSERLLSDGFDEAKYKVRRASNDLGSFQEPVRFGDQNIDVILKVK